MVCDVKEETEKLHVAFIGGISKEKGSYVSSQLIKNGPDDVEWYLFGVWGYNELSMLDKKNYTKTGLYERDELPKLIAEHKIDVICILPALGAPVGEDYHTIIKTTSSEGSVPASVAPGRLQNQGRKEAPCGVSSHLQGQPHGLQVCPRASCCAGPSEHSAAPSVSGFSAVMGPLSSRLLGSSST